MYGVRHHLTKEFPEYRGAIEHLKTNDESFAKLLNEYHQTDKKIYGYEMLMQPVTDSYMEQLKLWRLRLKDQLYNILRQNTHAAAS
jgi:uncharacterized protein YdcH (DUF465 family)